MSYVGSRPGAALGQSRILFGFKCCMLGGGGGGLQGSEGVKLLHLVATCVYDYHVKSFALVCFVLFGPSMIAPGRCQKRFRTLGALSALKFFSSRILALFLFAHPFSIYNGELGLALWFFTGTST